MIFLLAEGPVLKHFLKIYIHFKMHQNYTLCLFKYFKLWDALTLSYSTIYCLFLFKLIMGSIWFKKKLLKCNELWVSQLFNQHASCGGECVRLTWIPVCVIKWMLDSRRAVGCKEGSYVPMWADEGIDLLVYYAETWLGNQRGFGSRSKSKSVCWYSEMCQFIQALSRWP